MKLQTHTVLLTVPVFIILAFINAAVMFFNQRAELEWKHRQHLETLVITIAIWLRHDVLSPHTSPIRINPTNLLDLRERLTWLMSVNQIQGIALISAHDLRILFEHGKVAHSLLSATDIHAAQQHQTPLMTDIKQEDADANKRVILIITPLFLNDKKTPLLVIFQDANAYQTALDELVQLVIVMIISIVSLGVIIALLIAYIMRRDIQILNNIIAQVTDGNYETLANRGLIREIQDLGNSFSTMTSVLKDILAKTRQVLLEREHDRNINDLAATFNYEFFTPLATTQHGVQFIIQTNRYYAGLCCDVYQIADEIYVTIGRQVKNGDLQHALIASAMLSLLRYELTRMTPATAIKQVCSTFHTELLHCLHWNSAGKLTHFYWRGAPSSSLTIQSTALTPQCQVFHTLDADDSALIDRYIERYHYLAATELMEDVLTISQSCPAALFLIIQRDSSSAQSVQIARSMLKTEADVEAWLDAIQQVLQAAVQKGSVVVEGECQYPTTLIEIDTAQPTNNAITTSSFSFKSAQQLNNVN